VRFRLDEKSSQTTTAPAAEADTGTAERPVVFLVNQISSHGHLDMYARLYSECFLQLGYRVALIAEHEAGVVTWMSSRGWQTGDFDFFSRSFLRGIRTKAKTGTATAKPVARGGTALEVRRRKSSAARIKAIRGGAATREPVPLLVRILLVWREEGLIGISLRLSVYGNRLRSLLLPWNPRIKRVEFTSLIRDIHSTAQQLCIKPSLVFFLYLDMIEESRRGCRALSRDLQTPWAGILFHPRCLDGPDFRRCERFFYAARSAGAAFLNPYAMEGYGRMFPERTFGIVPDVTEAELPAEQPHLVARLKHKAAGRKIVLLLGSISPHKGVVELIEVIKRSDSTKFYFAIIGKVFWELFGPDAELIRAFFNHLPENCLVQTGYIKDESELNAVIANVDILYAVYQNFKGSSNTLTKASIFEKPIVVSDESLMGERVRSFRMGKVVNYRDINSIVQALSELAVETPDELGFAAYRNGHSLAALKTVLGELTQKWLAAI